MALRDHPDHLGGVGFWHKNVGTDDRHGFFAISGAKENPPQAVQADGKMRCDSQAIGPYGFHRWDEAAQVCSCGSTEQAEPVMGHHLITLDRLSVVIVVMEALPYGYILYFEMHDPADEEPCIEMPHSDCARTLQEVFRLLVEWDYAYTHLGSRELIAETCHGMVEVLEIPDSVQQFLLNDMPAEKVNRFLAGEVNARQRVMPKEVPDLTPDTDAWLEEKILNSMPLGARRL